MNISFKYSMPLALTIVLTTSCTTSKLTHQQETAVTSIKFLDKHEIPFNLTFEGTAVGGLSGIDYNRKRDQYYLISDDRSDKNPARFYTAKINIANQKIDTVFFMEVKFLQQQNGQPYPNSKEDRTNTPDPEAIRFNPITGLLLWSSEGERIVNSNDTLLEDPSVNIIDTGGQFISSLILPPNLKMQLIEKGPRRNGVLEGMTFADDFKTFFINVEEPLYEDGPRADIIENNAYIRIFRFNTKDWKKTGQFAYRLDPVAHPAVPENGFKINGVPDILNIGKNKLIVVERSFSTGRQPCTIKLFIADLAAATDISNTVLIGNKIFSPVSKKLLLNMDDLGVYIDNIEGVTFGPVLPNGHKTLLFIADNNFSPLQKTQLLLFEVID